MSPESLSLLQIDEPDTLPMESQYTEAELEAFLDEALDPEKASEIEAAAREDQELLRRLSQINRKRDAGVHSLGAIWRRFQIGVPSKEEMGQYLLGVLDPSHADYIDFRLQVLKCPYTRSLKVELEASVQQNQPNDARKLFDSIYQSSAGLLRKSQGDR